MKDTEKGTTQKRAAFSQQPWVFLDGTKVVKSLIVYLVVIKGIVQQIGLMTRV